MDENMENRTNCPELPISGESRESLRIQRVEYVRSQLRRRKELEDSLMAQLIEEQSIIDGLQERIDEDLEQTEETARFNRELKERMSDQIYTLHGVSKDKLEGIEQYRDAWRRGSVFSLFLLSLALVVFCGVLHGFDSRIFLFMLAFTGVEGALIAQDRNGYKVLNWVCRFLSLLIFPVMLVMFTCYELGYKEYSLFLPYAAMGCVGVLVIAILTYFLYDPYSKAKRDARAARSHMGSIEKAVRKENIKNRKKQEAERKEAWKKAQKRIEEDQDSQPWIHALMNAPKAEKDADEKDADEGPKTDELPEDFSLDEPEIKKKSFLSRFRRKNKDSEEQAKEPERETAAPAPAEASAASAPGPVQESAPGPVPAPATEPAPAPIPEPPKEEEEVKDESAPEVISLALSSSDAQGA